MSTILGKENSSGNKGNNKAEAPAHPRIPSPCALAVGRLGRRGGHPARGRDAVQGVEDGRGLALVPEVDEDEAGLDAPLALALHGVLTQGALNGGVGAVGLVD